MNQDALHTLFGTKTTHQEFENGDSVETTEQIKHGKITHTEVRHCETIVINSEAQVLNEFLSFMDFVREDPHRSDPEFKLRTDKSTGKIYRAQKLWTEPA